jgi:tetratricopeptide (TPR) repeat protein
MDRITWSRINELYEAARHLPAGEREAWVRAETTDERVLSEVLSLLQAPDDDPWSVGAASGSRTPPRVTPAQAGPPKPTPGPTDLPPAWTFSGTRTPTPSTPLHPRLAPEPKPGGQFASYRLIRETSRDAARVVFEAVAERGTPPLRADLHVLTADARDPGLSALFHAQGDLLARLDHPGIPRLIDGGVTWDGTAYFAFDHASGEPLDSWCRSSRPTVRDRVERVLAVCDAVQHAHERLVAHGDLRPANILVAPHAGVKVLHTGMASLLGGWETSPGGGAALHGYMSPEQVRGEMLTAASDVYALGILLYSLLTGYPPYELAGQAPARARHLICEADPDLPSAIVDSRDRRVLKGTLERIILKALRKNPRERYPTVAALAADLRAWRDGRPASVDPATIWSRLGGRGTTHVGTALLLVALAAAAATLGFQARALRGERDEARARLVTTESRLREAEARAARTPAVADMRLAVADHAIGLALDERRRGNAARAEALWTQALADLRPLLDAGAGDVRVLERVASVRASLGALCRSQRRLGDALAHYREALRARERLATSGDAPAGARLARAVAQVDVARLLIDLLEARPPAPNDAARLSTAGSLIAQAAPVLRDAPPTSPAQEEAARELARQSARLGRLKARRGLTQLRLEAGAARPREARSIERRLA